MTKGAFHISRSLFDSDIWTQKPSWWLKVWIYILGRANYSDTKNSKKGECFISYEDIYKSCHLSKEGVKVRTIDNAIRWLRERQMLTTRKTKYGMVVSIVNYSSYQDLNSYRNDTGNDTQTTHKRHINDTLYIKEKKEEKESLKKFSDESDEMVLSELLLKSIRQHYNKSKNPNMQNWCQEMDKMIRIDGRNREEIATIIMTVHGDKSQSVPPDSFWASNILSPSKLREKFDTLVIKLLTKKQ